MLILLLYRFAGVLVFRGEYAIQTLVVRHSYMAYIALRLLHRGARSLRKEVGKLYVEIRDSRYLHGTELTNRRR